MNPFKKIKFWKLDLTSCTPYWWRTNPMTSSPRAQMIGLDKLADMIRIYRRKNKVKHEKENRSNSSIDSNIGSTNIGIL